MKTSFMLTTQRQNCNLRNGRFFCLQDPNKHVRKKANWERCWLVSLTKRDRIPRICPTWNDGQCRLLPWCSEKVTWKCAGKRPQKWQNQNLIIHHDNAPAHRSFKVSQFLTKNKMSEIPHPPYSPDLALCDFFFFPKLKLRMKGQRFDTTEEIQEESRWVLDTIPKWEFQGCFQAWQKGWDRCISAKWEYFEGDGGI